MLLTRKRAYYLLRELECVSCRSKQGTRLFINGQKYKGDDIVVDDSDVEAFCIHCAHKAQDYVQKEQRRSHVNEALALMELREKAKIPTRYDAYRTAKTKEPLTLTQVYEVLKDTKCTVCGRTDKEMVYDPWIMPESVLGYYMWPDSAQNYPLTTPHAVIDVYRDCVWLCHEHHHQRHTIKLSLDFDENFYNRMRALYS